MTRHHQALESDDLAAVCPIFRDARNASSRTPSCANRGTVGGSLCQADPPKIYTVCTGAERSMSGPRPVRRARNPHRRDFLTGPYETSLAHNEMLIEIRIPLRHHTSSAYAKGNGGSATGRWRPRALR